MQKESNSAVNITRCAVLTGVIVSLFSCNLALGAPSEPTDNAAWGSQQASTKSNSADSVREAAIIALTQQSQSKANDEANDANITASSASSSSTPLNASHESEPNTKANAKVNPKAPTQTQAQEQSSLLGNAQSKSKETTANAQDAKAKEANAQTQQGSEQQVSEKIASNTQDSDKQAARTETKDVTASLASAVSREPSSSLEGAGQNKFGNAQPVSSSSGKGALQNGLNTPLGILQWLVSTVGVLIFIFVLAHLFKKSRFVKRAVGSMQIENQIALGPKERLVKVKVQDRSLLLGVTANNVNLVLDLGSADDESNSKAVSKDESLVESTPDTNGKDYSSIYRSASASYEKKLKQEMLSELSKVVATETANAVAVAIEQALQGKVLSLNQSSTIAASSKEGASGSENLDPNAANSGESSESAANQATNQATGQEPNQATSQGSTFNDAANSNQARGEDQGTQATYNGDNSLLNDKVNQNGQTEMASQVSQNGQAGQTSQTGQSGQTNGAYSKDGSAGTSTVINGQSAHLVDSKLDFARNNQKAIVKPHVNEDHGFANHFSSEHTIVRASRSVFSPTKFNTPPDNQVLHARAQRSKHNTRALELEVEPKNSRQNAYGYNQRANDNKSSFDSYLHGAYDEMSRNPHNGRGSRAEADKPWIAEDDLAQAMRKK